MLGIDKVRIQSTATVLLLSVLFVACQKPLADQQLNSQKIPLCNLASEFPDLSQLGTPRQWDHIGNSHLPISTTSAAAQKWFDQGLNHLHTFLHLEAFRAFEQVLLIDPNCAMGYWGIAMCQPGFGGVDNSRWTKAITQAYALRETCTGYEQDLIVALKATIENGLLAASDHWEHLIQQYYATSPDIIAISAIMLRQVVQNETQSGNLKLLLETALSEYPNHVGLGHYFTHVMETRPDFTAAKPVAEKMASLAYNASHIVHMQGHIYFQEGQYNKAITAYKKALALDEDYHLRENIPFSANQNYFHNLHFLAIAYSEVGDKSKSLEMAQRYANLTLRKETPLNGNALMILYEGRILPARVHIRFREYEKAAKHIGFWLHHPAMPIENVMVRHYLQAMQHYCHSMDALQNNSIDDALVFQEKFQKEYQAFADKGLAFRQGAELASINHVFDLLNMAQLELRGWLDNIDPNRPFQAEAWGQALALEQLLPYDDPPRLMYPVGESLLHLHLKRGDVAAAAGASELALIQRPNSPMVRDVVKKQ